MHIAKMAKSRCTWVSLYLHNIFLTNLMYSQASPIVTANFGPSTLTTHPPSRLSNKHPWLLKLLFCMKGSKRSTLLGIGIFPTEVLLMVQKSGVHQLRLVVYPIIYKVLCIPGVGFLPSTVFLKKTFLFPRWGDVSWQEGTPLMDRGLLENPLTARFTEKNADLLRVKAALKKHLPVPYHWPLATCIPTISTTQL